LTSAYLISLPAASLEGFLISLQGSTHQPITEIEKLATLSQDEGPLRL